MRPFLVSLLEKYNSKDTLKCHRMITEWEHLTSLKYPSWTQNNASNWNRNLTPITDKRKIKRNQQTIKYWKQVNTVHVNRRNTLSQICKREICGFQHNGCISSTVVTASTILCSGLTKFLWYISPQILPDTHRIFTFRVYYYRCF